MGGAFTSIADDASALFWNPAGLARIGHQEVAASHAELFNAGIQDNRRRVRGAALARSGAGDGLVSLGLRRRRARLRRESRDARRRVQAAPVAVGGRERQAADARHRARWLEHQFGPRLRHRLGCARRCRPITGTWGWWRRISPTPACAPRTAVPRTDYPRNLRLGAIVRVAQVRHRGVRRRRPLAPRRRGDAARDARAALRVRGRSARRRSRPRWSFGLGFKAGPLRVDWARVMPPTLAATDHFAVVAGIQFQSGAGAHREGAGARALHLALQVVRARGLRLGSAAQSSRSAAHDARQRVRARADERSERAGGHAAAQGGQRRAAHRGAG